MKQLMDFIKGVRAEWFKIIWPTRDAVVKATVMIIIFSAVAALFFFITDSILNALVNWIF
jgi:preprotein translocase subunit SecE